MASVEHIRQIAPKGFEATSQGLLNTVRSMGRLTGTSVGGFIMETRGGFIMYRIASIVIFWTMSLQMMNLHREKLWRVSNSM